MLYKQIRQNKIKTIVVVFLYIVLFTIVGAVAGYYMSGDWRVGIPIALVMGIVYSTFMVFQGRNIVMYLNGGREADPVEYKTLHTLVNNMAILAKVPKPKVYVIEDDALNAFATGSSPKYSAVAVTTGLMNKLNRYELQGVIAHEMAHIKNYDVRLQTITIALGTIMGLIVDIAFRSRRSSDTNGPIALIGIVITLIITLIIAPMVALAISRAREYQADAWAARLTRNPYALISALEKISENPHVEKVASNSAGMFIASPLSGELLSTHPKIEKRIERLQQLVQ